MNGRNAARRSTLPCLFAALSLAACGDGPAALEGDALSQAEIQAVLSTLNGTFSSISTQPTHAASTAPALAPTVVDQSFDTSVACPHGGSIGARGTLIGTFDDETLASDLQFEITFAPAECVVATPETHITVGGSIDYLLDMVLNDTLIDMSGWERGRISYTASDGRSGSCLIDITFSTTVDQSSSQVEQSVSGTICGMPASQFQVVTG